VHQLEIKVVDIVDARCNHEVGSIPNGGLGATFDKTTPFIVNINGNSIVAK